MPDLNAVSAAGSIAVGTDGDRQNGEPALAPTTVITLVRGRERHLDNLLLGLANGCVQPARVVVVDMGSARSPLLGTLAGRMACDAVGLGIELVQLPGRPSRDELPLAAARNLGAAVAPTDHLIFLDVDCIPAHDLVDRYRSGHGPGLVCGPVRYLRRDWETVCRQRTDRQLTAASSAHPARPIPQRDRTDTAWDLFWSLSFATDRATFSRIGGFDEGYVGYGGEDTDLAYRARDAGVTLRWLAAGVAYHQWHPSSSPPVEHLGPIVANATRFRRRWGTWPMEGWLETFARLGLVRWTDDELTLVRSEPATPRGSIEPPS